MDKRNNTLIKNTAILTFGNLCTKGIMFVMTPLFTRWISQTDYGTFDLLVTYLSLIVPVISIDIKEAVFRFLLGEEHKNQEKAVITTAMIANTVSFVVCIVVSLLLSLFIQDKKYLILFYALMIISEAIYELWVMIARGLRKINVFAVGNIIYVATLAIVSVLLVKILDGGLIGLMCSYVVGYLVSVIYMGIACKTRKYIDLSAVSKNMYAEMLKYSVHMLPNAIAWWVINVSDRTLVSMFLGLEANAVLAITNKLPNLCHQIFSKFHLSWQETATDSVNEEDRDAYYSSVMNNLFKVMVTLVVGVISLNFFYFQYLFTEEYFMGYYLCPVMMVAILIYMMTQFLGGIYIAQMQSKKNGNTTIIAAVINLVINLMFIKLWKLWAAVISTFVAYLILFLIRFLDINKTIKLRFEKQSLVYLATLLYFVAMCYVNNMVVNIVNFILACVFFIVVNRSFITGILVKLLKKFKS